MADWRKKMREWSVHEMRDLQAARLRNFLRDKVYPFSPFYRNDEIIVCIAPQEGAAVDEVRRRIESRMRQVMEVTPTQIVFEPLHRLLERLKMETEMKELRIVDRRLGEGGRRFE